MTLPNQVLEDIKKEERMDKLKKLGIGSGIALAVLLVLLVAFNPFVVVDAGERGVVLTWGAFKGDIMDPGLHYRMPIVQKVKKMNVQSKTVEVKQSQAYSKDLQMVNIQSSFTWNAKADQVGEYYQQYKGDATDFMLPRLEAAIKETIAQYTAEEILSQRGKIQGEIFDKFKAAVPGIIELSNYSMMDEAFTPEYEAAIEAKQIAQQNAEKASNDLERIKIESDQTIVQAQAQAESIRIQGDALKDNNGLVELKAVEKWNGALPTYMMGDSVPFINLKAAE